MMSHATMIELKPNRSLLSSNFDGYKLSLDPVPVYSCSFPEGTEVEHTTPADSQYSFQHAKIFGFHNHLVGDTWNPEHVYFIDKVGRVWTEVKNKDTLRLESVMQVWEIPSHHDNISGHYNPSVSFPSSDLAIVADGSRSFHLVETGQRSEKRLWKVVLSETECGSVRGFLVSEARETVVDEEREVHCLLQHVEEEQFIEGFNGDSEVKEGNFATVIDWITLAQGNNSWHVKRRRRLVGTGGIDYVSLEADCRGLYIASEKRLKFIFDSEKPVVDVTTAEDGNKKTEEPQPEYFWMQTNEDITLTFKVDKDVIKTDIFVEAKTKELKVRCKNRMLLEGPLWSVADSSTPVWFIEDGKLEVVLNKAESGSNWNELVVGDKKGEQVFDPILVEEVHERLAHLCSDKPVADKDRPLGSSISPQQLEECDAMPADTFVFVRFDGESHQVTHQASLGSHQWLFNTRLEPKAAQTICLRHDVDGLLWQPEAVHENDKTALKFEHVGTFHAFGYVQASKQQKKFCVCALDLSYVAICETSRHIYIYRQPSPVDGDLRNRKTGVKVDNVAKQQVVTLETTQEILGAHASNTNIYLLLRNSLCAISINPS